MTEGTVIICNEQTKGKGQRGNSWESKPGENLTLSVILKPTFLRITDQFYLNIVSSLAVRDTVAHFLPNSDVKVKWPNDVLVNNRKIAGILIENSISQHGMEHAVVGIGLNADQQTFHAPRATSLCIEGGKEPDKLKTFEQLMSSLEYYYLQLKAGRLEEIKSQYLQHLFGYKQKRKFRAEYQFEGTIEDVTDTGHLVVVNAQGRTEYDLKEIEFIY